MAKKTAEGAPTAGKKAKRKVAEASVPTEAPADDIAPEEVPAAEETSAVGDRIVVFTLDGQRYALPIDVVQEIQQLVAFSELPDASPAVIGAINLRGQVVPAVDLRLLVGVATTPYGLQTPMVFCRTSEGLVALIVDEVEDVVDVPRDACQPPSKVYALADRLLSVCRLDTGLVFVFDIDSLIGDAARTAEED